MSRDSDAIFRCGCGSQHFLSVSSLDKEGYLTLEGSFRAATLRDKLKAIYEILRNGHYDTWVQVLLDREIAMNVRNELSKFIRIQGDSVGRD